MTEIILPQIPQHYVKVPKEIIKDTSLTEHRISTLIYLNYNQTWDKMVGYSPKHIIQWSGYKPNWRSGMKDNIYDKFKNCMSWFHQNGYILDFDEELFKQNTFQSSSLNKEKLSPQDNFGLIYDFEIEAIINYKSQYKPLNKSILLLLLSYIRAFTWIRKKEMTGHSELSKRDKPEVFHSKYETMAKIIGIRPKLISKATLILEELGIINTHRMPRYKDQDGNWHIGDIIFICPYRLVSSQNNGFISIDKEYDWEKELEYGINYLRECKYVSKKFYQE